MPKAVKNSEYQKAMVVTQFTKNQHLKSATDLSFEQANEVITKYGGKPFKYDNWAWFDVKISQHKYILSLLQQLEWSKYDTDKKRHLADLHRFSEWLKSNKSPVQKPLKEMKPYECSKVISALESMLTKKFE